MSHKCEGAVITCEDFRLHQRMDGRNYIADFIKKQNIDCDLITRGGGIQDLVRPKEQGYRNCLLRDSDVSAKLHKCSVIYLVNHQDCGAYSGMNFTDKESELEQHIRDLKEAGDIVMDNFSEVEVKTYFAYLKEGSEDEFEIKEV